MKKKLKVLVVPSDRTGVSYFRSTKPHLYLEQMYPDEFHVDIEYEPRIDDEEWLKQYDIIHYHRTLGPYEHMIDWMDEAGNQHEGLVKKLNRLGIKSVMDIDDYWAPGQHHPAYHIIKSHKLDEKIVSNIKAAENVTTTTDAFADEISKYNKNVSVIPNGIDPKEKQFIPAPVESERIRIGWLGGSSHLKDLEILTGLVGKLKTDGLLDKIQFVLCGFDLRGEVTIIDETTGEIKGKRNILPHESVWYKYEQIFTDNHSTISPEYKENLMRFTKGEYADVDNEPYRRVWTKPISSYATNYNLFDISLAPLEENKFNKMKSQLKVIEAGFYNKAIVAQNFGPYKVDLTNAYEKPQTKKDQPSFNEEANSYLIDSSKNHKQWYQHLKRLINNPEQIKLLGDNLHKVILESYSMEKITEDRKNFYYELVSK